EEFRDNCGFGLVAHVEGKVSHHLLETAIRSLTRMTHRGGIAADGVTGDGCGILMQKPDGFLRSVAREELGATLTSDYGIGMVFLSQDEARADQARETLGQELQARGLQVVGWRKVPCNTQACGKMG